MTEIIYILNPNHITFQTVPDHPDDIIRRISRQEYPLPADTAADDWIEVNDVLIIALTPTANHLNELTHRQREILNLILTGRSMSEVAFQLKIKPCTVEYHLGCARKTYQVTTRTELIAAYACDVEREKSAGVNLVVRTAKPTDVSGTNPPSVTY